MKDTVSIIVPCYNAMPYLSGFIGDVRRQTYTNWELIIISNGKGQEAQFQLAKELTKDIKNAKVIMTPIGGGKSCPKYWSSTSRRRMGLLS